jgi:hypothetical protein
MFDFSKFDKEFVAAHAIADKCHELLRQFPDISMNDRRNEGPNPYYDRTSCGLRLEFYYGMPNKVHTPWGYYKYGGSGCGKFDDFTKELFKFIQVKMLQPGKQERIGYIGPIYTVISFDGIELPEPSALRGFEEGFYAAAKHDWAARLLARKIVSKVE